MSYVYCTLAIGREYFDSAVEFARKLNKKSHLHKYLVVTNVEHDNYTMDNTIFVTIQDSEVLFIKDVFNYNLKYIPIKHSFDLGVDVIIYVDADWMIHEEYTEEKVLKFIEWFNSTDYDFLFERPHKIGGTKKIGKNSFCYHKIEPYKLLETDKYDNGDVPNEQFLVFKGNKKLGIFCGEWKKRNEFGVTNQIWPFAEGLEIGMSSVDANMNSTWSDFKQLNSCFMFYPKLKDKLFIKF